MHKFKIYIDKTGRYRFSFLYNDQVIFRSGDYSTKSGAERAIASIKRNVQDADVDYSRC